MSPSQEGQQEEHPPVPDDADRRPEGADDTVVDFWLGYEAHLAGDHERAQRQFRKVIDWWDVTRLEFVMAQRMLSDGHNHPEEGGAGNRSIDGGGSS